MSYLHSQDSISSSNTSRPTPAPPLKSVCGLTDRAVEGSAMLRAFDVVAIMAAEAENKSAETFIVVCMLLADAYCNLLRGRCFAFVLSSIYSTAMVLRSIEFID